MPTKFAGSAQARKMRTHLKKLKSLGLYSGDLRRTPGRAAKNAVAKYGDVLAGKASVVQPSNPKRFKNIFEVKGKNVIVPRRKGEKIRVDKTGEIVSTRKVGNRKVTARGLQLKRGEKIKKPKPAELIQYVIPFNSRGGGTSWVRFPNYDELQKFMAGYDYKGWQDYVVVETIGHELDDDELNERLERKRKGRRIKGGIKKPAKKKRGRKK